MLTVVDRSEDALAMADAALELARSRRNPFWLALTLLGYASALEASDPDRALTLLREAHGLTRAHPIAAMEPQVASVMAEVEARQGDADRALELFDDAIASFHRSGEIFNVPRTIAGLAMLLDTRLDRPDIAATLVGFTVHRPTVGVKVDLPGLVVRVRSRLGDAHADAAFAAGAQMDLASGVRYAREQIASLQRERAEHSATPARPRGPCW
jgi:tetratricopeptide (TPR) repeat protein